jgi:hypothetical protein
MPGVLLCCVQAGAMVCRPCHNAIHRNFDNKTLAMQYSSVEKLMQVRCPMMSLVPD